MKKPVLIIVLGAPATGKTHLAKKIADHFCLPLLSKDAFKEHIFDGLGWDDRAWSIKVGKVAFTLIDYVVEQQLRAGHSIIVESPYNPQFENEKFQRWQKQYHFTAVQVLCYANGPVLLDRFAQRSSSGERHPGHVDAANLDEFHASLLSGKAELLDLRGAVIKINTTDFAKVDEPHIFEQIQKAINN